MMIIKTPSDGYATEHIDYCPICMSKNTKHIFDKYCDPYAKCQACGAIYLENRPDPLKISEFYSEIGETYQSQFFKIVGQDNIPNFWKKYFASIDEFRPNGNRHLDVGCGVGECLQVAKYYGWNSTGQELGKSAAQIVTERLEMQVFTENIKKLPIDYESIDLITINAVLEHVSNPNEFFQSATRYLRPGGILVVLVPSVHFLGYKLFGKTWHMIHSCHLNYFSKVSLSQLMTANNIDVYKSYSAGGGNQGHRIAMNMCRTDIAWTIFSIISGCRKSDWNSDKPLGWFSNSHELLKDPRIVLRNKSDKLIKKTRVMWDAIGYPIHRMTIAMDMQQSILMFGRKNT